MALPRIYQKLFQNEGASSVLRPDIVPACDNVTITTFNPEVSGEYTLTGDKKQADGYPYDTSDAVYFKVINTGDELIQYWYHGNVMLVRYKKGTDGEWTSWEQVGKDVTSELEDLGDRIINGDNELAAQIQQLNVADITLLGKISSVETRVSTVESNSGATDIDDVKARLDTVEGTTSTNATDISGIKTRLDTVEGTTSTNATDITDIKEAFSQITVTSNWESVALQHNNIYRGANLLGDGHFASIAAVMAALRAGNFDDIYVGDYIPASYTVDGTTQTNYFRIAGINTLNARRSEGWGTASPNMCLVPAGVLGTSYMNATSTTAGGYVGSYMYTTTLPKYYQALAGESGTPFYGYLRPTTERLSKSVDTALASRAYSGWKGAVNVVDNYTDQNLTLLSETEVYGHPAWSSCEWDEETMAVQLPMFRLNPCSITEPRVTWWLRDVAHATLFCNVDPDLCCSWDAASVVYGVRPRFFVA